MKKAVFESNLEIMISLIIISFIISISVTSLNYYKIIKENQIFKNNINEILNNVNYLVKNNNIYGFKTLNIKVPFNDYLIFDNLTNTIKTENNSYDSFVNLINFLNISHGEYNIILCYDCNISKEYLVKFN